MALQRALSSAHGAGSQISAEDSGHYRRLPDKGDFPIALVDPTDTGRVR
jgi:hypothetical protein